jgi:glycosyltransferase involved in cell wall biosynthesis
MNIVYPVSEPLRLQKARDARIMRMAAAFALNGHSVCLIVAKSAGTRRELLDYYGAPDLPTLNIVQLPFLRRNARVGVSWNIVFHVCALAKVWQMERRVPIDVLYLSVLKVASFFLRWRKCLRVKRYVYELHELGVYPETRVPDAEHRRVDRLERRVLPAVNGVVVPTVALAQVLQTRYPTIPVTVIPLGTANDGLKLPPYQFDQKAVYHACYIGQAYAAQGVDVLVRACAHVENVHLHIIGGQPHELEALRQLAADLGVANRATFHGFVSPNSVWRLIPNMDLFVLPARDTVRMNYVAHIKIYEYLSYGRPIVATTLRSTCEELRDGYNAVLVAPDDPEALAQGIRRVIDHPAFAREIAARALEMTPMYTWENRTRRIEEFIGKLP